jgi:hypothetical protein
MDKRERSKHAISQNKYFKNKRKTHQIICTWVPYAEVGKFQKVLSGLKKKWAA